MIEPIVVTLLPTLFLIALFVSEDAFRRMNIDMGGTPPIDKAPYLMAKYAIPILWGIMALQSWGMNLAFIRPPDPLKWLALALWILGFTLLITGRFGMGNSFRIGSPNEETRLKTEGLFRFSRNPMYVGVYATILATILYTLNPIVFLIGTSVIAVHHKIVRAEEQHLQKVFGEVYIDYCRRVRRYL
jgi:protein-S-isoprenylcysteine O-methyltransferase Ste14